MGRDITCYILSPFLNQSQQIRFAAGQEYNHNEKMAETREN